MRVAARLAALWLVGVAACRSGESPAAQARQLMSDGEALLRAQTPVSKQAALVVLRQAEGAWARAGNVVRQADAAGMVGEVYDNLGDMRAAATWSARALELYRRAGDRHGECMALNWIGIAQVHLGQVDVALVRFRAALALARAAGDLEGEAYSQLDIGFALQQSEDPARVLEAQAAFHAALAGYRVLDRPAEEAVVHNNLGRGYLLLGDAEQALAHHHRALELREREGLILDLGWTYLNLADVHLRMLDEPGVALDLLERALRDARAIHNPVIEPYALEGIGHALLVMGRPGEARDRLEEALVGWQQVGPLDRVGHTRLLLARARLALGDLDGAQHLFDLAVRDGASHDQPTWMADAQLGLAELAVQRGDLDGALTAVTAAVDRLEAVRGRISEDQPRLTFLAVMRDAFDLHVDILHRRGDDAGAFRASEQGRARGLLETLAGTHGPPLEPGPADLAAVQHLLDRDTVLIKFHLGRRRGLVWVVSPDRVTVAELPPRAVVEGLALDLQRSLTARNRVEPGEDVGTRVARIATADAAATADAVALSRLLLSPIAGAARARRWVVIADGALNYVPLAALPAPGTGQMLIASHDLIQVPSSGVVRQLRRRPRHPPAQSRVAVLADPVFSSDDVRVPEPARTARPGTGELVRLPFTRDEAAAIAALVPSGRRWSALDFDADREALFGPEVAEAAIVHVATHAVVDTTQPERSGLVLSSIDRRGRPRTGLVGLPELARLHLHADLVVLSACETALGKQVRGEGLLSVTRAVLGAGAIRVMATSWRVDDRATAELMRQFYRRLLLDGRDPAAALAGAQRAVAAQHRWAAPYYWAGVTLHGDWR